MIFKTIKSKYNQTKIQKRELTNLTPIYGKLIIFYHWHTSITKERIPPSVIKNVLNSTCLIFFVVFSFQRVWIFLATQDVASTGDSNNWLKRAL